MEKSDLPKGAMVIEPVPDPLGYKTADFWAAALAMAEDALSGKTEAAVQEELDRVRANLGLNATAHRLTAQKDSQSAIASRCSLTRMAASVGTTPTRPQNAHQRGQRTIVRYVASSSQDSIPGCNHPAYDLLFQRVTVGVAVHQRASGTRLEAT